MLRFFEVEKDLDRKKRTKDFFFDIDQLEEMIDSIMDGMPSNDFSKQPNKPVILGFSMKFDGEGNPYIEEFGNVGRKKGKTTYKESREPLFELDESKKEIILTFELPGAEKKNISVETPNEKVVIVRTLGQKPSFYKKIKLPAEVKTDSSRASFKNGILEVVFQKTPLKNTKRVKVE